MLLFILMAVMAGLAALAVLWQLRASPDASVATTSEVAVYEAQLAEIARDFDRGLIGEAEAEGLRAEAARRLIRQTGEATVPSGEASGALFRRRAAALFVATIVPLGAIGIYHRLGAPHLPDQPLAARGLAQPESLDVQTALTRIEQHLEKTPGDLRGWDLIAPIYLRMGRPRDAARAYETAIRNGGATPDRWASLGEARMMAEEGMVTATARAAFEEAVKLQPGHPKAGYGLAVARQQDGDVPGAIRDIEALIAAAPADAAYLPLLRESLSVLKGGPVGESQQAVPQQATPQPVPSGGEAVANLPPEQRQMAIRGMVDGLAARLEAQGGTAEEWARLIRARVVLDDRKGAEAAYHAALQRLAGDAPAVEKLKALGLELALPEAKP